VDDSFIDPLFSMQHHTLIGVASIPLKSIQTSQAIEFELPVISPSGLVSIVILCSEKCVIRTTSISVMDHNQVHSWLSGPSVYLCAHHKATASVSCMYFCNVAWFTDACPVTSTYIHNCIAEFCEYNFSASFKSTQLYLYRVTCKSSVTSRQGETCWTENN